MKCGVVVILAALPMAGCANLGSYDNFKVTCGGRVVYTDVAGVMLGGGAVDVYRRGELIASLPPGDGCRVDKQ